MASHYAGRRRSESARHGARRWADPAAGEIERPVRAARRRLDGSSLLCKPRASTHPRSAGATGSAEAVARTRRAASCFCAGFFFCAASPAARSRTHPHTLWAHIDVHVAFPTHTSMADIPHRVPKFHMAAAPCARPRYRWSLDGGNSSGGANVSFIIMPTLDRRHPEQPAWRGLCEAGVRC